MASIRQAIDEVDAGSTDRDRGKSKARQNSNEVYAMLKATKLSNLTLRLPTMAPRI
jgi:hypothetical protein